MNISFCNYCLWFPLLFVVFPFCLLSSFFFSFCMLCFVFVCCVPHACCFHSCLWCLYFACTVPLTPNVSLSLLCSPFVCCAYLLSVVSLSLVVSSVCLLCHPCLCHVPNLSVMSSFHLFSPPLFSISNSWEIFNKHMDSLIYFPRIHNHYHCHQTGTEVVWFCLSTIPWSQHFSTAMHKSAPWCIFMPAWYTCFLDILSLIYPWSYPYVVLDYGPEGPLANCI